MLSFITKPILFALKFGLFVILIVNNSGCSVITETECRFADFAELGYADATKGKLREHFNQYHEKCLSYGIDLAEEIVMYDFGRERGLMNYCANVKYSRQCDRGGSASKIKSNLHINAEMIRLRGGLPNVNASISR